MNGTLQYMSLGRSVIQCLSTIQNLGRRRHTATGLMSDTCQLRAKKSTLCAFG